MASPARCRSIHGSYLPTAPHGKALVGEPYERHRPETTVLHALLSAHWQQFLERSEESGGLPRFVVREVEEYLRCGLLEHGCIRVGCPCGFERLVAFSCKRRGFCPSCIGRRMTDLALDLSENVIPEVPLRQWVCSLPFQVRYMLGYDKQLCSEAVSAFTKEVSSSLRRRAKAHLGLGSARDAHTGMITFIQRFDSGLRLNPHFHTLALDGVYVRDPGGQLRFEALPPPTEHEVEHVARRTAQRLVALLKKHGRDVDGELEPWCTTTS